MKYIPALDGVRAIAILLVLVFHWFPEGVGINILPNGPIGVTLFFVLSGYLISNILMEQQTKAQFFRSFKNFVIRRALRIFPIYFLVLAGLLVLKEPLLRLILTFMRIHGIIGPICIIIGWSSRPTGQISCLRIGHCRWRSSFMSFGHFLFC